MNNFTIKDGNYYVLANSGDDGNPGTIDAPRATFDASAGGKNCILRGTVEQSLSIGGATITGDVEACIKGTVTTVGTVSAPVIKLRNIRLDSVIAAGIDIENVSTSLTTRYSNLGNAYSNMGCKKSVLILYNCLWLGNESTRWENLTIKGFSNGCVLASIIYNSICYGIFDLYNFSSPWNFVPIFKYSVFLKNQTVFKWNGAVIPITWTAAGNEKQDIIDSLKAYADNISQKDYLINIADNLFGIGTIVYDDSPGNIRIFNEYDADGNPSDLNLNMENGNPALFSSSAGDYVGAMRPAFEIEWDWENMKSIDEDGNVIDEVPDLLQENNGIFANIYSAQKRNRVKAKQVMSLPGGDSLSRIAADFESAADRGIYFGAWQDEIDGVVPIDAFEAEVYDTPLQPSAYPHLLIPFNRNLEIAYFKTGDKAGQPVLFSDLEDLGITTDKNLPEVSGWAVTNGTIEFYDAIATENTEIRKPKFRHILPVLTVNKHG
jgi:hypothetical protein